MSLIESAHQGFADVRKEMVHRFPKLALQRQQCAMTPIASRPPFDHGSHVFSKVSLESLCLKNVENQVDGASPQPDSPSQRSLSTKKPLAGMLSPRFQKSGRVTRHSRIHSQETEQ